MTREITISASTRPVCSSFFKIREQDSEYQSMEEFAYTHSEIDNSLLQKCFIKYRDKDELTYEQYVERFHEFVGTMRFVTYLDKQQYHDVGHEVGQRVHGISYHGSRSAQDSCRELENQ